MLLLAPAPAFAHDPGQGELVAEGTLEVAATEHEAAVVATLDHPDCEQLTPVASVARRGGRTIQGPLETAEPCTFAGAVAVDEPGRWFVYAELADAQGRPVEFWLPIVPPEGDRGEVVRAEKADWAYHPAGRDGPALGQIVGGVVLYALAGWLLLLAIRTRSTTIRATST